MKALKIILRVIVLFPFIWGIPLGWEAMTETGIAEGWKAIFSLCGVITISIAMAVVIITIVGLLITFIIWLFTPLNESMN